MLLFVVSYQIMSLFCLNQVWNNGCMFLALENKVLLGESKDQLMGLILVNF